MKTIRARGPNRQAEIDLRKGTNPRRHAEWIVANTAV
jgi:hypothetical protein